MAVPGVDSATIILPYATAPTQKAYKYAVEGMQLSAGDFVYVIPVSGTYVLIGGAIEGGGGGGLPAGGAAGQIPVKASAADYDAGWQYPQYNRPNLLDNAVFEEIGGLPVNQRGQSSYTNAGFYIFDRWKLTAGSVELTTAGLVLTGTIQQVIEKTISQQYTASVLTANGIAAGTFDTATKTFTITSDGSAVIRAAKLELGTYQTLAHQESGVWKLNVIPDYAAELSKCQRYLQVVYNNTLCIGMSRGNRQLFMLPLAVPMAKASPTISGMNGAAIITQSGATTIGKPQNITTEGGTSTLLSVTFDESAVMTNWAQNALITTDGYFHIIAE